MFNGLLVGPDKFTEQVSASLKCYINFFGWVAGWPGAQDQLKIRLNSASVIVEVEAEVDNFTIEKFKKREVKG